ncbi:MAG: DNA repair protein RadC [bacterium]|nr:DNA repair protein RadC [bacterium]
MQTSTLIQSYALKDLNLMLDQGEERYMLRISDLPQEEKPREKLIASGSAALSTKELIAVILNTGSRKEGVLAMSGRLLKEYGEKAIINQKDPERLKNALDIPLGKACQIVAALELGRRFFKTAKGKPVSLRTPKHVYDYLKDMRDLPKEHLRGLYLNSQYRLVHDEVISIGSLTGNIVHPREVFSPAIEYGASAVILAHNHPSGVAAPSQTDTEITRQLVEAGNILGIELLDHIIITAHGFSSILHL